MTDQTSNAELADWVAEVASLCQPDQIHWCDGSQQEYDDLAAQMLADGTFLPLNPDTHPNSFLHRSDPTDVARTEHLTFVCTTDPEVSGPNNQWMSP
ncbi:MAG: hypothetical protein JKY89_00390, partial [Immundisolibacteraceae bacterium]|nr:hypothetical protein [Immundisolibacteraceae bacterium]